MNKVKFSVFSDLHHYEVWCGDTEERLDKFFAREKMKIAILRRQVSQNQNRCT